LGIALVVLAIALATRLERRALWGGVAVVGATAVFVVHGAYDYTKGMRVMERDFYGVVRTADHPEPVPYRSMYHGGIMHGGQLLGDSFRNTPADYFSPGSAYGRVFTSLREIEPRRKLSVGVLGFQATNRYIDLLPVVKRLAAEFGMEAVNIADLAQGIDGPEYWYSSTEQVIVTRNRKLLDWPRIEEAADEIDERADLPTFTDSHHNLLRILK